MLPTVWISRDVDNALVQLGERWRPYETGGILLGWKDEGGSSVIAGLLGGGPSAIHTRSSFLPDDEWQFPRLRELFLDTGGDLNYLGEWHSHPTSSAAMSFTDKTTLRRTARRVRNPLMIIVGRPLDAWEVRGWIGSHRYFHRQQEANLVRFDLPDRWPTHFIFDPADLDPHTKPS